jgi:hypothetical protein
VFANSPVRFRHRAWRSCFDGAGPTAFSPRSFLFDRQDNRGDGDREVHCKRLSRFGGRCGPRRRDHSGLAWRQRHPHTMENARRKAYTALSLRTSTTAYAKRLADGDPVVRQQVTLPNVIAIPGGLPIKVGDDFIGGVGVSGSPGVDDPCVQAGLDKVADQLN